jgi:hypothetical protein
VPAYGRQAALPPVAAHGRRGVPRRTVRGDGPVEAGLAGEDARPQRGRQGPGLRGQVVRPDEDLVDAEQPQQRRQLAGEQPALLDAVVDRGEELARARRGPAVDLAHDDRLLGERGGDRARRLAPRVAAEQGAGQDHRPPARGGRLPGVGHGPLPVLRDLAVRLLGVGGAPGRQRPHREQRHDGEERQRGAGHGPVEHPQAPLEDGADERGDRDGGQHGHAQRGQRRGLVRRPQELDRGDLVVDVGDEAVHRRAVGEAHGHRGHAPDAEQGEERGEAPAPRPGEAAEREQRQREAGEDDQRREQQVTGPADEGLALAEPDAEVDRPVAEEPQRLGQAVRREDRHGLLGEGEEVRPVAPLDEDGHDPPQREHERRDPGADAEGECRPGARAEHEHLVDDERGRREEHPGEHGGVHSAPRERDEDGHGQRPPPRPPGVQPTVGGDEQPRQRDVGEQRHRAPVEVHEDVGVDRVEDGGDQVHGAAPARQQRVDEPDRADPGQRDERPDPQALGDPGGQAGDVREREPRAHRHEVADELRGGHVPEVRAGAPHGEDLAEEPHGVDGQLDPRVEQRLPGALGEREHERQQHAEPHGPWRVRGLRRHARSTRHR